MRGNRYYSTERSPLNQLDLNPFKKGHFFLENFNASHNPYSEAGNEALMPIRLGFTSYQHSSTEITIYYTSNNAGAGFLFVLRFKKWVTMATKTPTRMFTAASAQSPQTFIKGRMDN